MPNNFDRLEKLFRKRDFSIETNSSMPESTGSRIASLDQSFPQPSFIRPRVSRMKAREERVIAAQNEKRAQSLPESPSERVSIHVSHLSTSSMSAITLPVRSLSLSHRRESQPIASLRGFDFPCPPSSLSPASPFGTASTPGLLPPSYKVFPEHRHSSSVIQPPTRSDTPPSSDYEDDSSIKGSQSRPSSSLSRNLPTPASSPEMKPVRDGQSRDFADLSLAKRKATAATIRRRREEKAAAIRRSQGHSRTPRSITSATQILKGGDVTDFYTLSDDDILEEEPELEGALDSPIVAPAPLRFPPSPPTPSSTSSSFRTKRRTSSIHVDDVAKEGALQAAQIAAKHKFDLVYIVNLWPESTSESSSPTSRLSMDFSSSSASSSAPSSRPTSMRTSLLGPMDGPMVDSAPGMTGRLLAAYGLSNLTSPFRISATVQSKILKQEGWMEYRCDDAQAGEFARGYGHAFHTHTGRRSISGSRSPVTRDVSQNDHGIVFAAYRYPSKDSRAVGCSKQELEALRVDAEGLVDYLVAIHKARRLRDPMTLQTLIDEDATIS
ncbi:uncharacterized protein LY79DRAFT_517558 [Colletotrichum navitas]|uniref:Uncharacterized protein n=1 Tax=Colletotrichum navitas TaxID=681940 RepID=A0AAD8PWW1_9PEZI|nr:uncharacterized protein LY79DRAFT_517558 [Colletotrichum navitas]KAK1586157.1 hypothetical protein LY79DRAFT_517558 [Colletotrichum navitas]